jgi:acetyltransferase-like isoleucine patch superfamily enzyme
MSLRVSLLHKIANVIPSSAIRTKIYRFSGVVIGEDVFVGANVSFDRMHPELIEIGNHTAIGANVTISAHQIIPTNTDLRNLYPYKAQKTRIENDVWVMPSVIIAPGVVIGHHSVLATGSVIHKDVPPYSFVTGFGYQINKSLRSYFEEES